MCVSTFPSASNHLENVSSERFPHVAVSDVGRVTRCQVPWESYDCVFMCKNVSRCWGQRSWWETWRSWTDERGVTHSRHPHIIFHRCVIMSHSEDQLESKPHLSFQAKGNLTTSLHHNCSQRHWRHAQRNFMHQINGHTNKLWLYLYLHDWARMLLIYFSCSIVRV